MYIYIIQICIYMYILYICNVYIYKMGHDKLLKNAMS